MSIHIHCPNCGERPLEEVLYGEVPVVPDSITDPDERDIDRGFMHENAEGPVVERSGQAEAETDQVLLA